MKRLSFAVAAFLLLACPGSAEEKNGLRLSAQKTLLDREIQNQGDGYWNKVSKDLGLKIVGTNTSFKELPEGTLSYVIIVKRWGRNPEVLERFSGTEPFGALKPGQSTNLTVGKVSMSGYEAGGNRKDYQDSIEGWQVSVSHKGAETIKVASGVSFERLNAKAKDGKK